jgi:cell division protein FtsB
MEGVLYLLDALGRDAAQSVERIETLQQQAAQLAARNAELEAELEALRAPDGSPPSS